jgi:IS5 family transposase
VNADAKHKLIRRYEVTDAAVHDSQKLEGLLTRGNTSAEVFADSAYRSTKIEAQAKANRNRSKISARMCSELRRPRRAAGSCARSALCVRAPSLQNLAYNIRRLMTLERIAAA